MTYTVEEIKGMSDCQCGNYKAYGDTLGSHEVVAPMMPMDACVNCIPPFDEKKFAKAMDKVHKLRNKP